MHKYNKWNLIDTWPISIYANTHTHTHTHKHTQTNTHTHTHLVLSLDQSIEIPLVNESQN